MNNRYTPDDVGPAAPRNAVTFGPCAVAVGFLVGLVTLALAVSLAGGFPGAPAIFLFALWYGFMIGVLTGLPLGVALGILLRRVRNQWIHVGVFFGCFAAVALLASPRLFPSQSVLENLPAVLVIGGAGALARASVWTLVRVH